MSDLYNFAVGEVVSLLKKIKIYSFWPSFFESELMGLTLSHWAKHIDPNKDTKSAWGTEMFHCRQFRILRSKPHSSLLGKQNAVHSFVQITHSLPK
jgi:hypothetical protein